MLKSSFINPSALVGKSFVVWFPKRNKFSNKIKQVYGTYPEYAANAFMLARYMLVCRHQHTLSVVPSGANRMKYFV
jgi:hypothetical protein